MITSLFSDDWLLEVCHVIYIVCNTYSCVLYALCKIFSIFAPKALHFKFLLPTLIV